MSIFTVPAARVGVVLVAFIAILLGTVYNKISVDNAAVAALPVSWDAFSWASGGKSEIIFKDDLTYCEDTLFDHQEGIALLSCDAGRGEWNTVMGTMYDPEPKGGIYIYDYKDEKKEVRHITLVNFPESADFHPLGINIYREGDGPTRLFVANHQRNGSTVDIFDISYSTGTATFLQSISDEDNQILSPNAIAPISYTSFYLTNDHRFIPRLNLPLNKLETFASLRLGWVTLVDFSSTSTSPQISQAANKIGFANGIVLTPTGKEVIVASTTRSSLQVYDRDTATNILRFREEIPLTFYVDNLTFDESLGASAFDTDGRFLRGLVAAGHPAVLRLVAVSHDPKNKVAPSWVVEVRKGEGADAAPWSAIKEGVKSNYSVRTLYQSNGEHFSSSSTGAVDFKRGKLLVSGLYAKGMLEISWSV